jgi:hypothetical protein
MDEIESKINKILRDRRELEKLLLAEKERRRVGKDKLVFIGMANVANYYWCAMESLLKNKEMEPFFFASYLHDRVSYSVHLGLIGELPKNKEKLLEIGDEIAFGDIERLLEEKAKKDQGVYVSLMAETRIDKNGSEVMVMNPDLPEEEIMHYEEQAKSKGIRVAKIDEFPDIRGRFFEDVKSEQYPSIRWNFDWNGYIVVGVPDGITDDFVYEFKTTKNRFLMYYRKPVALTQADLMVISLKERRKGCKYI